MGKYLLVDRGWFLWNYLAIVIVILALVFRIIVANLVFVAVVMLCTTLSVYIWGSHVRQSFTV